MIFNMCYNKLKKFHVHVRVIVLEYDIFIWCWEKELLKQTFLKDKYEELEEEEDWEGEREEDDDDNEEEEAIKRKKRRKIIRQKKF